MSKPILHDPLKHLLVASQARPDDSPTADRRPADVEMARVLRTAPCSHGFRSVQWRDRLLEA